MNLCQDKTIQLINQFSVNGNLITTKNSDYYLRFLNLCDTAQKEIATVRKIPNVMQFSQNQIPNLISQYTGVQISQHTNQDVLFSGLGAKSYTFECDGNATITIEVNGVVQSTINCVSNGIYVNYNGVITSIASDSVVIRCSGQYVYNVWNIALYAYNFAYGIPPYRAYLSYAIPPDFMELRDLQYEMPPFSFIEITDYRIKLKNLMVNSYLVGNMALNYWKYPTTITKDTLMTTELECEVDAQELIPYYCAAHLYMEDNAQVATQWLNEYEVKLSRLKNLIPDSQQIIQDVWGWGDW